MSAFSRRTALLSALLFASAAGRGEDRSPISLGLTGGWTSPAGPAAFSSEFDASGVFGGRIKYDFHRRWSLAVRADSRTFRPKNGGEERIILQPVSLAGHFQLRSQPRLWKPYAALGLGMSRNKRRTFSTEKSTTKEVLSLGLGVEVDVGELNSVALEADLRQFSGASIGGHGVRAHSLSLTLNFYLPESWIPPKPVKRSPSADWEDDLPSSSADAQDREKRHAQEELDKVQRDVRDRKIPPIRFETGQAVLPPASFETLDVVGTVLRRYPRLRVRIVGHPDGDGAEEDDQALAQARAEVIRAYLIQNFGLADDKLSTADDGSSEERRVLFEIVD